MNCPACGGYAANVSRFFASESPEACRFCGYAFNGPQKDALPVMAVIARRLQTIKLILSWWFWLLVLGGILWFLIAVASTVR